jgi:two-component system, OmpR family, sensor kinase
MSAVAGGRVRRWSTWSLRTRLLVTTTLMMAVVCGVIALTTTLSLEAGLTSTVADRLDQAQQRAYGFATGGGGGPGGLGGSGNPSGSEGVGNGNGGPGHRDGAGTQGGEAQEFGTGFVSGPGQPVNTIGAWIHDGAVVSSGINASSDPAQYSPDSTPPPLNTAQKAAVLALAGGARHTTISLPGHGDYLIDAQVLPDHDTVLVGLPLTDVDNTLTRLVAVEAVVTVAGLILAGFVTFALIRISLRPLDRVAATAVRISRQPLDRGEVGELVRVPEADTDARTEAGQVGASLNRLIEHVAGALAARHASETRVRQFVADASHELRTPLASIAGYAELTRRGRETVPPDTAYALSRVESEAARMTRLVEDLLLLARLDAGRPLDREPLDLSPLVMDAVRDAHAANPGHRWQVDLPDDPVTVDGDAHRLHQVLVNLLANAGKHTPSGTVVTASIAPSAEGDSCELRITDNGPGIPEALLPTVFERFARGDSSRSRAAGSTGLGLAIVAAVAASHGGQVSVRSEPGRTVFALRLPLAAATGAAAVTAAAVN